jgi:hypothetical protein
MGSGPSYSDLREVEKKLRFVEAILCGLIRASGGGTHYDRNLKILFAKIDWKEAGVTEQQAFEWWKNHLLQDQKRTE